MVVNHYSEVSESPGFLEGEWAGKPTAIPKDSISVVTVAVKNGLKRKSTFIANNFRVH